MFTEVLAYVFIGLFIGIPSILRLKNCLHENPLYIDDSSASQLTLRVPENGGVE